MFAMNLNISNAIEERYIDIRGRFTNFKVAFFVFAYFFMCATGTLCHFYTIRHFFSFQKNK